MLNNHYFHKRIGSDYYTHLIGPNGESAAKTDEMVKFSTYFHRDSPEDMLKIIQQPKPEPKEGKCEI